jgi:hypothetical protein
MAKSFCIKNHLALSVICLTLTFTAVCSLAWAAAGSKANDPLMFPKDRFTVETRTVKTSGGETKVTYRSYMHIPYVANPVDKDYESLNVSVPIKVDDLSVDATNAPILFAIDVGGFLSSSNVGRGIGEATAGGPASGATPAGRGGQQGGMPQMPGGPPGNEKISGNADLALAAGYVVVSPGCRGRDNKAADGTYYGKAPAAIVDLKAAVRYIRHNKGVIPGNVDWIISTGVSAGGGFSALLGASGNSPLYDAYLKEIGAADAGDNIYASGCYSPATDLEHNDMAYEWMYGRAPLASGNLVDQELSKELKALFVDYQASLNLQGKNGFGTVTADNYDKYLLQNYLIPSAKKYLKTLTDEKRSEYLSKNKWVKWDGSSASFAFADYVAHTGRQRGIPGNDDFEMKDSKPILFGNKSTDARHFTDFTLQKVTGDAKAKISDELQTIVIMMNPMYFIGQNNKYCVNYWWLRHGTAETGIPQTVIINLTTSLENQNKSVNTWIYWNAGHGANEDPEDFIAWIGKITGFTRQK